MEFAKKKGYSNSVLSVLTLKPDADTMDILDSCRHNRDKRSALEYGLELVLNWIVEDFLLQDILPLVFNEPIEKAGVDKNREFLINTKVKSDPDLVTQINGKTTHLEVVTDFNGWWTSKGTIELRDSKFLKLRQKAAADQQVYLFALDVSALSIGVIPITESTEARFISEHGPFRKPVYQLDIDTSAFIKVKSLLQNKAA